MVAEKDSVISMPIEIQEAKNSGSSSDSHVQILKSSATVGGSTALSLSIGVIRTKAIALLLGPAGFGIFGLYASIASLAGCLAELGINSSGVRQIAYAVGSNDAEKITRTTIALRRTSILLGAFGAVLLVVLSKPIARITFGSEKGTFSVALLSAAVFFQIVSDGQGALIQGMRRIRDLAMTRVLGAFSGTVISIALIYFFRQGGVVPSLVCFGFISLICSWWFSRKIHIQSALITLSLLKKEVFGLLNLGLAFMGSTFAVLGSGYLVRIIVLRKLGFEATGYYQSAWTIAGLYVGFILEAMSTDFYPRLTAASDDNDHCNRLVNEQVQVGLLLATPGVIAALTFAPLVIVFFYSAKFAAAVGIFRWMCLGTILQVITWPMSYVIAAKQRQVIFLLCELAFSAASIGFSWALVKRVGLTGAGIAFLASTILYGILLFPIVRRLSGFHWDGLTRKLGLSSLLLISLSFASFYVFSGRWAAGPGSVLTLVSAVYSARVLVRLVSWESIPSPVRRALLTFRIAPGLR